MDALQQFLDHRGPIRHQRRGETFPAAPLWASITTAYERRRDLLAERERATADGDPQAAIDAVLAEYAAHGDDGEAAR